MIRFKAVRDDKTKNLIVEVPLTGHELLDCPMFNKGSAFTQDERRELSLKGLLPPHVSTIGEQLARSYANYLLKDTDLGRHVFLTGLKDRNEVLFYRLLLEHIAEMMPMIYTPVVGEACQNYSHIYRRPRGLFVSYPDRADMDEIIGNVPYPEVSVIVVTDGERILGLGDQGAGGMGIPVGKLSLYTLCAGIHPATALPVLLDVGTDNEALIDDPLYLGWRHKRIRGEEYDDFVDDFVDAVKRKFPDALLQWEDFSKANAARLLEKYRDRLLTFNDDIQGTGSVALAGIIAAMEMLGSAIGEQRIAIFGAGSAAIGISDQIVAAAVDGGMSRDEAASIIHLVDRGGYVHTGRTGLEAPKRKYAQPAEGAAGWGKRPGDAISLAHVVKNIKPTILIGTGAQPGAFSEEIVRDMAKAVERPIIFPLSNPTSKSEARPSDLMAWTEGRAIVATGSPFPDVEYGGRSIRIGQCNNAFIFPGVGLGAIAAGARRITEGMFIAAARALARLSPARQDRSAPLYPKLEDVRSVSREVAIAVAMEAQRLGLAPKLTREEAAKRIDSKMWKPEYPQIRRLKG